MLLTRGNKITWLGHSTFAITLPSGKVVLLDPWLTGNPACPEAQKTPERVDAMLISHGHGDHLGDAVALGKKFKPQIACNYEIYLWLASKGVENISPMNKGGTQRLGEIEVTMVDAKHSSGIEDDGKVVYAGEPAGFVVRLPGGLTMYHAGDTAVFGDMKLIGELYEPELACLPIGDLFTMGPREAAAAARMLRPEKIIPMHFKTFPPLTGRPGQLAGLIQDVAETQVWELTPGVAVKW
jgi:L-ascorbate metabolism protein UlaG (beta-lactamase superfamily)